MIVSRADWHYRLYRFYEGIERRSAERRKSEFKGWSEPTNLCPYFWLLVAYTLMFPMLIFGTTIDRVCVWLGRRWPWLKYPGWALLAVPLACMVVVMVAFIACFEAGLWLYDHRPRQGHPARRHRPSLLVETVKAKKDRLCPRIEVRA